MHILEGLFILEHAPSTVVGLCTDGYVLFSHSFSAEAQYHWLQLSRDGQLLCCKTWRLLCRFVLFIIVGASVAVLPSLIRVETDALRADFEHKWHFVSFRVERVTVKRSVGY